jgi:hypothetical protein
MFSSKLMPLLIGFSWIMLMVTTFLGLFLSIFMEQALWKSLYDMASLIWLIAFIFTICCFVPSARTFWGSRILADFQKNHDVYDVNQRFALYGYKVVSGGSLDDLKQIFMVKSRLIVMAGVVVDVS